MEREGIERKGFFDREMQMVAFRVGKEDFAVDVMKVESVIPMADITRMPRAPEFVEGIINLRGQIIPLVDLAKRLGIEPGPRTESTRIVVVESGGVKVGLIVESPEVVKVSMEDLEASPGLVASDVESAFIKGIVKLSERLLIALDVDRILTDEEKDGIDRIEKG
ncbi:MAG: chemotaxis protein CheW [Actinomycetota bacterium]|nr:chemotaxis protein CheW [Actinomycetota bacterium]